MSPRADFTSLYGGLAEHFPRLTLLPFQRTGQMSLRTEFASPSMDWPSIPQTNFTSPSVDWPCTPFKTYILGVPTILISQSNSSALKRLKSREVFREPRQKGLLKVKEGNCCT
ncbi:hypothetical protein Peur_049525 [Populus x canadensis]